MEFEWLKMKFTIIKILDCYTMDNKMSNHKD
jgi:hypothetical protein